MSTNGRARTNEPNVASSFAGLTHDVIELAELQSQLLAIEARQTAQRTRMSLILATVGVCFLLGSISIALIELAELLLAWTEWPRAACYGISTLVGLALSIGLVVAAWLQFKSGIKQLDRSRDELSRNIAWVKSSLRSRADRNPTAAD